MPWTATLVRRIALPLNPVRAIVIGCAAHAELRSTTSGSSGAGHVVAATDLLDALTALRTTLQSIPLEELQQRHLVRILGICVILLTSALRVPNATVVRARAVLAMVAPEEAVPASLARLQVIDNLATATSSLSTPAEIGFFS